MTPFLRQFAFSEPRSFMAPGTSLLDPIGFLFCVGVANQMLRYFQIQKIWGRKSPTCSWEWLVNMEQVLHWPFREKYVWKRENAGNFDISVQSPKF